MIYSLGQDILFSIFALASAISLIAMQGFLSAFFFILSIIYVLFEDNITQYFRSI